jgi:phosphoribosylglycinamide formyltransferase 1
MAVNIAIFASGSGSNALKIIEHFEKNAEVAAVRLLVVNKEGIGAIDHARAHGVPVFVISNPVLRSHPELLLEELKSYDIGFIALAGFLAMVPPLLTSTFAGRLVNIHPSLLPAYGGKGMYGARVHQAVLNDGCHESGISIHHVNEVYDDGEILHQERLRISPDETVESLQQKIQVLEHAWYPRIIEQTIRQLQV